MDKIDKAFADWNADTTEGRAKRRAACAKDHKKVIEVERENGEPLHFCTNCATWIPLTEGE